jgi:hypothetical protein
VSWTEIGSDDIHMARKAHRCTWCGEHILVGEKYLRRRGICEDGPSTVKHHMECEEAAAADWKEWGECYSMFEQQRPTQRTLNDQTAS